MFPGLALHRDCRHHRHPGPNRQIPITTMPTMDTIFIRVVARAAIVIIATTTTMTTTAAAAAAAAPTTYYFHHYHHHYHHHCHSQYRSYCSC